MADKKAAPKKPAGQLAANEPNPRGVTKGGAEAIYGKRFPCWPDLVYEELICMVVWLAFLMAVSIWIPAPLEEHAEPSVTPNPSKAPWYFLGLQEMLVYFDPWIAGVLLPGLIIIGLCVLPYVDPNPEGVGEYSFFKRPFAVAYFTFGMFLWFGLIFIGNFLRGPNWDLFMPGEDRTVPKPPPPKTVNLHVMLGLSDQAGMYFGGAVVGAYFVLGTLLPPLVSKFFRRIYESAGFLRYTITMFFVLTTLALLIKIFLRLAFAVKYVWVTPWFNV